MNRQLKLCKEVLCHLLVGVSVLLALSCAPGAAAQKGKPGTDHPSVAPDRLCISMKALAIEAQKEPLRDAAETVAGIGWLEGYVVDTDNQDVILVGRWAANWPTLHLDDLVANMRNIWNEGPQPYCSLDPRPHDVRKLNEIMSAAHTIESVDQMYDFFARLKDTWGPQNVVVGGVPENSRHANVMIQADYHMKKVSQGLVQLGAIRSCLDILIDEAKKTVAKTGRVPSAGLSMSRFWFHLADGQPTFQESEGIVLLDQCSIVLLTERQRAAADGSLYDSGEDDPNANMFAREFSRHFDEISPFVEEYADLENLFRLRAVLRVMFLRDALGQADLDPSFFLQDYRYRRETVMPSSLPGLANAKEAREEIRKRDRIQRYILLPMACGGVSMDFAIDGRRFTKADSKKMNQLRKSVINSRPAPDSLSWNMPGTSN
jgi:hypothetical protein